MTDVSIDEDGTVYVTHHNTFAPATTCVTPSGWVEQTYREREGEFLLMNEEEAIDYVITDLLGDLKLPSEYWAMISEHIAEKTDH